MYMPNATTFACCRDGMTAGVTYHSRAHDESVLFAEENLRRTDSTSTPRAQNFGCTSKHGTELASAMNKKPAERRVTHNSLRPVECVEIGP